MFDVKSYVEEISTVLEKNLKDNIQKLVYDNYQPIRTGNVDKDYIRSYGLIKSVKVISSYNNKGYKIKATFDENILRNIRGGQWGINKAKYHYFNAWKWGKYNPKSFMYVPFFVNEGYHYNFLKNKPTRQKTLFMERTVKEIHYYLDILTEKTFDRYFNLKVKK